MFQCEEGVYLKSKDLRGFINELDEAGELLRVKREVDPKFELTAVLRKTQKTINKALLFNRIRGQMMPVVSNVLASRKMVAMALDTSQDKIMQKLVERENQRIPVKRVTYGPCKEVIEKGEELDLTRLPIITHCEKDAGPYITAGVLVFKKDDVGKANMSFNRMQLVSKRKLRARMMPPFSHIGYYHKKAEESGKPLQVAVCIGNHPHIMFAASTRVPIEDDELEFAGALRGDSIEVVPCETIDVDVPADTEIVIEGKVLPNVREEEGPFGEFTDSYVTVMKNHVFEATAITHRKNAIYQTIYAGGTEDLNLVGLPVEVDVYKAVKRYVPTVKNVRMVSPFNYAVSIKKESEDNPKNAILAALAARPVVKICTVVDDDVNVDSAADVSWAVSTRCRPDTGIYIIPTIPSYTREDVRAVHQGKVGIDATVPLEFKKTFERRKVPGEENIKLEDYLA